MSRIASFTFNPFAENTYIIYDDTLQCVIIDPGCYTPEEKKELVAFIEKNKLKPQYVLNTHCHIDHVLGNYFLCDKYNIPLVMHKEEVPVLKAVETYADTMGIVYEKSPDPEQFLDGGDTFSFGNTTFEILYTPGHSPASICFYNKREGYIISGDVLFLDSIGRYDLPGGNLNTLMQSINTQLMTLDDIVNVYPGHGPETTVGRERKFNPFLREGIGY
ncbi:MAG: MBL fold metallo-hydrolase [Chitinophagales bacterium]|nr:MBL fold metallo-hydrolase [Chitinophagales bacterium]